jgi:hypothetical protein
VSPGHFIRRIRIRALFPWLAICLACCLAYWLYVRKDGAETQTKASHHAIRTAARPLPPGGPGGPILVISSASNPFSHYYSEILLTEGLNEFEIQDISRMTLTSLKSYDVVILGEMPISAAQGNILYEWVRAGGNLIAMRPDRRFARKLGLRETGGALKDAYMAINTQTAAGKGLVKETIQFHGTADLYSPVEDESVATLYRDSTSSTGSPAIATFNIGAGQSVVFAYDLARSIVYTRQGNPAWSGMERDGIPPMRANDLFYGATSYDNQPDWVDLSKVAIPQADEQQRLLVNLILEMNIRKKPLPRFWYFPRGLKAVVIMTGDDHGQGGTIGRFKTFQAESPPSCSVDDWQCVRGTSNIFPGSISDHQARKFVNDGFEIGLHVDTGRSDWPQERVQRPDGSIVTRVSEQQSRLLYSNQLAAFARLYPDVPAPSTSRTDCITWGDFDTQPQVELQHGIRLDTNYYYWPSTWVRNRPGMFTGSGIPMRFAKVDGQPIDVYQAATQMTDESGQTYPFTIDVLLDNAIGAREYVGAFTANMHTDKARSAGAEAIVESAKVRNIPIVSAVQMLRWLDGRDGSSFQKVTWNQGTLQFDITVGEGSVGLQALLPLLSSNGLLTKITVDGSPVNFQSKTFAGQPYAAFPAAPGRYEARYLTDQRNTVASAQSHIKGTK